MKIELERIDRTSFPMGIMDLAVASDGSKAFAACMDGLYEHRFSVPNEGTEITKPFRIGMHSSYVSGIRFIESSSSLISCSYDGTVQCRNLDSHSNHSEQLIEPNWSNRIHQFWSWRMAISPNQHWIASVTGQYLAGSEDYSPLASPEPTIRLIDSKTGAIVRSMDMLPSVQCVAFDPTSKFLVAANLMGDLAVWEVETGKQLAKWNTPVFTSWGIIKSHCYIGGIYAVAFSPDSDSVYAAGMGEMRDPMAANGKQRWQRFNWRKEPVEKIQESVPEECGEGLMETLAWCPNRKYFVMAGRLRGGNWNAGFFDAITGKLIGQAKTGMRITSVQFSPDGTIAYFAGMQGQPAPKNGVFQNFGYLERYRIKAIES